MDLPEWKPGEEVDSEILLQIKQQESYRQSVMIYLMKLNTEVKRINQLIRKSLAVLVEGNGKAVIVNEVSITRDTLVVAVNTMLNSNVTFSQFDRKLTTVSVPE